MDIDDVSGTHQYIQNLEASKANLKAASARTGQIPIDRKSRNRLVNMHRFKAMTTLMQQFSPVKHKLHSSFLPPPYPPSIASLEQLTAIFIEDLRLGVHHRGSDLLIRSITAPNRMTAVMNIVEDEKDDVLMMHLYQQPDESVRPTSSIITLGDTFVIKEPFYKIMGDGEYGLRIDHVSDLVRIDPHHNLWPKVWTPRSYYFERTVDAWKQEGNAAMGKRCHWDAIRRYFRNFQSCQLLAN